MHIITCTHSIEQLANKSLSIQADFPSDDFPKEVTERLEIIARCDKYLHAVKVKDHMLWVAIQEKKKLQEQIAEESQVSQEYATEVAHWASLSQQLTQQLHEKKEEIQSLHSRNIYLMELLRKHNIYVS